MPWPVLLFGWGPVVVAAAAWGLAFRLKSPWLAFAGAVIAMPFLFTITGYPILIGRLGGPIAVVANFAAASLLRKGRDRLAMALLLPFVIVAGAFAFIVITQDGPSIHRRTSIVPAHMDHPTES